MSPKSSGGQSDATPRRAWWRFGLRTLLVGLAICCLGLGWWVHGARNQRLAVARITELGGRVHYDYEFAADGRTMIDEASPPGPAWLYEWLDIDLFCDVRHVYLQTSNVTEADLPMLVNLRKMNLLAIWGHQISDLSPLESMSELEYLNVMSKNVSDQQVERLQRALPNCMIHHQTDDLPGFW